MDLGEVRKTVGCTTAFAIKTTDKHAASADVEKAAHHYKQKNDAIPAQLIRSMRTKIDRCFDIFPK